MRCKCEGTGAVRHGGTAVDAESLDVGCSCAPVNTCGCGRSYTSEEFRALPRVGVQELPGEVPLLLANCACGSTIAIEITSEEADEIRGGVRSQAYVAGLIAHHLDQADIDHGFIRAFPPGSPEIAEHRASRARHVLAAWRLHCEWRAVRKVITVHGTEVREAS